MRELTDRWARYEIYAFMFISIQMEWPPVFLLRKDIKGVKRKIFLWKSKHKVKGAGKVREEPNS
jgi:hypothetical protein